MYNGNNLPHQLWLITRQKTKLRYSLENNLSTYIKLPKVIIIQSGESLGLLLSKISVPLA